MKTRRAIIASALVALVLVFLAVPAPASPQQPEPLSAFPQSLLAVRTEAGYVLNFKIWTADTQDRMEQGLMFQRELDEHAGMWFLYKTPAQLSMWMENTYLPLDLLFVDAQGRIDYIAAHAVPLSRAIIQAPRPVIAVLELNGGACERLGIRVGDHVLHASLPRRLGAATRH